MRAIDSNILVRQLVRDDPGQVQRAELFVASGAWVSHLVLAESTWVLVSVYGFRRDDIAKTIQMLLDHTQFTIQDSETVVAALQDFTRMPRISFSDALILAVARKNGHLPFGTFDRDLARLEGALLL
jgi:predicted nucleic-acid-binding protein